MGIERIGVIGAGQMGNGIAHVLSLAGFDILLDDVNEDALKKAIERIDKNMHRQAARGLIKSDDIAPALKRIHITQKPLLYEGPRPRDRGCDRGRGDQAQDLSGSLSAPFRQDAARDQHLVDLGDAVGRAHTTDRPEHFYIGLQPS